MVEVEGQTQNSSRYITDNFDGRIEPVYSGSATSQNQPQQNENITLLPSCPDCGSKRVFKDGFRKAPSNAISSEPIQRYRCADYGHRFSEHSLNAVSYTHLTLPTNREV